MASEGTKLSDLADLINNRIQTVVFVRHGVAQHNYHGADLTSPTLLDPPLVAQGAAGAFEAGQRIQMWFSAKHRRKSPELVICSPLTRCLQTALLAFLPGAQYESPNPPKFACVEQLREAFGMHYPDRRRPKSLLEIHWPMVEFDSSMTENDELWSATERESYRSLESRIDQFLEKLCKRPEQYIVVISHGVWIETLLHRYQPQVLEKGRRVYNCDAFAAECASDENQTYVGLRSARVI